ncbi:MAG: hypothetical protein AB1422_02275 [bacterium]
MKKLFVLGSAGIMILVGCNLTYALGLAERAEYRTQIAEERSDISFDRQETQITRQYDAQLEKVLTDIHGNRVRVEEYVLRPQADQVKFLSFSHREGSLNSLWFLQEFNKDLPEDITQIAFRWDWPGYPEWYAEKQTIHLSNTIDSVEYEWTGEKPEVMDLFNAQKEKTGEWWILCPEKVVWRVNNNDKLKVDFESFSFEAHEPNWSNGKYPNGGKWSNRDFWWNNTFLKRESYIIDDEGNSISWEPSGLREIERLQRDYNIETIYTATEFEGRTIDTIMVPKIFLRYASEESLVGGGFNTYLFGVLY